MKNKPNKEGTYKNIPRHKKVGKSTQEGERKDEKDPDGYKRRPPFLKLRA